MTPWGWPERAAHAETDLDSSERSSFMRRWSTTSRLSLGAAAGLRRICSFWR